jgi:hypothetical protein
VSFQPIHPRDAYRSEIRSALAGSFPETDPAALEDYGAAFIGIAEANGIPIESVRFWLHDKPPAKDFSLHGWRLWCEKYAALRAQLPPEAAVEPEVQP